MPPPSTVVAGVGSLTSALLEAGRLDHRHDDSVSALLPSNVHHQRPGRDLAEDKKISEIFAGCPALPQRLQHDHRDGDNARTFEPSRVRDVPDVLKGARGSGRRVHQRSSRLPRATGRGGGSSGSTEGVLATLYRIGLAAVTLIWERPRRPAARYRLAAGRGGWKKASVNPMVGSRTQVDSTGTKHGGWLTPSGDS
jgi:hypothetical protein